MNAYTVKQVAQILKTNEETVRRWIRSGKLSATLTSKKTGHVITADALNHFIKQTPKYGTALTASVASSSVALSMLLGGLIGSLIALVDSDKKTTAKDVEGFLKKKINAHEKSLTKKEMQVQKLKEEIAEERRELERYQYALNNLDLNVVAEKMNENR